MVLRLQWCSLYLLFLCSIDFRMGTKLMWWSCAEVLISQAFDTVPHRELLARSVGYGCHQKIINWLANYLSDRKQSVNSFKGLLLPLPINQGIIQGSGFGPCCFIAYIADLWPKHTDTVYCKFADDLTAIIREDSRATDKIKHIVEWYLSMLYFCKSSCSSHCTLTIFIWQTPLVILLVAVWQSTAVVAGWWCPVVRCPASWPRLTSCSREGLAASVADCRPVASRLIGCSCCQMTCSDCP